MYIRSTETSRGVCSDGRNMRVGGSCTFSSEIDENEKLFRKLF